jgi:hypothetical protein
MTSTSKNARIAGFLYLLLVIAGPLRLMYIPSTLFVHGNASAMEAKRRALDEIATRQRAADEKRNAEAEQKQQVQVAAQSSVVH